MEEQITTTTEKPYRIEVEKNTKGYNFSVKVSGDSIEAVQKDVKKLIDWCKAEYGA